MRLGISTTRRQGLIVVSERQVIQHITGETAGRSAQTHKGCLIRYFGDGGTPGSLSTAAATISNQNDAV
jgi:hypothetical protein